jgi:hypothetical protein
MIFGKIHLRKSSVPQPIESVKVNTESRSITKYKPYFESKMVMNKKKTIELSEQDLSPSKKV